MRYVLFLLRGLLVSLVVAGYGLALAGCATGRYVPAIDPQLDSALVAAGLPPLRIRRLKFTGPVTIQLGGTGNVATVVGKARRGAALATAPHAAASAPTTPAGAPWWGYLGLAALGATGGFLLRGKLRIPLPF